MRKTGSAHGKSLRVAFMDSHPVQCKRHQGKKRNTQPFISLRANYFNYFTILILAIFGGMLGTLMMIPLRRSLIVKEHGVLPYPEGTACASVLKAGERGGEFAKTAFLGLGFAAAYAALRKSFSCYCRGAKVCHHAGAEVFPFGKAKW